MGESCKMVIDGGILDIGTRYAIYGTALLTIGLGGLAMISVNRAVDRSLHCRSSSDEEKDEEMYAAIGEQKKKIRPVGTTLNIMGIAIVFTAFFYQYRYNSSTGVQETNDGSLPFGNMGPFTLFHGYMLLSLLWLITFTGMMIHINAWVFNVIRRQNFRHLGQSKRRFVTCIWNGTHWYLLQVELMGIYGYYLCTHWAEFPRPPCEVSPFNNIHFQQFAKIVYIIAMIPVLNVALLCIALVGPAWIISLFATHLNDRQKSRRPVVSPAIFNFFWLMICAAIVFGTGVTIEVLVFTNTQSQNLLTFGSLLALTLLSVPGEIFVGELYLVLTRGSREPTESNHAQLVVRRQGPHRSVERYQVESYGTSSQDLVRNQSWHYASWRHSRRFTISRPAEVAPTTRSRYR
ncbi:hypothetical protein BDV93DRAFT_185927 [Ceratobasidium sp. AG-I]|nr:hypothetical protein BDV93DRAFT_185927 [Ceratobasidium sp. AG-I]